MSTRHPRRSNLGTKQRGRRSYVEINGRRIPQRRAETYFFICAFKERHDGRPPTYQEITDGMGWKSPSVAYAFVQLLADDQLLTMDEARKIIILSIPRPT